MKTVFKLPLLATLITSALHANAGVIVDDENNYFSIGGDVELDLNYQDRDSQSEKDGEVDQTGRILVEFAGERTSDTGHYAKFKVETLMGSSGDVGLDDVWLSFGEQDGWDLRVGRFEAYDMFPVGQDTFLEYSGDTAEDLYSDDSAYIYQMKEARGRGADGQLMYSQKFQNLYIEIGSQIGDRTDLFADSYHGKTIDKDASNTSFMVRPIIAYQMGNFNVAASMETNLVKDAIVTTDGIDISDRTGYGLTTNYNNGDLDVNVNVAYMDAVDETNTTIGANILYHRIALGYVYAENEYENDKISGYANGDVLVNTFYASYEIAEMLDIKDFSIFLGTYYTTVENDTDNDIDGAFSEDDDLGFRVRFKYFF